MVDQPRVLIPHLMTRQKSAEQAREVAADLQSELPAAEIHVADSREESLELAKDAEIVVSKGVTSELLNVAENLRWIQALSAGLDRFVADTYGYEAPGLDRLEEEGIALTNLAGVMSEPMAEQVLAYLLAIERNLSTAVRKQDSREWGGFGPNGEIEGKTIGIVGVGSAGTRVAQLVKPFNMTVIGTKRDIDQIPEAVDEIHGAEDLGEILPRSDYLVIACPLTDETRGLIGTSELDALPDEAVVINIARGQIIDQDALVDALTNRTIRAAGLDVFDPEPLPADSPLWDRENVILTPHYAGGSPRWGRRTARLFARNYARFREDGTAEFENRIV